MVRYGWADYIQRSQLQNSYTFAEQIHLDNPSSFQGTETLLNNSTDCNVTVSGVGTITLDYRREYAAWLEFDAVGLSDSDLPNIYLSVSEYNAPGMVNIGPAHPNKTLVPVKYSGNGLNTYRLEPNAELYEGVKFGFLIVSQPLSTPFVITSFRLVTQVKAVEYNGDFVSPVDPSLSRIWWTAGYTIRLNLLADYFGSILMDRGIYL